MQLSVFPKMLPENRSVFFPRAASSAAVRPVQQELPRPEERSPGQTVPGARRSPEGGRWPAAPCETGRAPSFPGAFIVTPDLTSRLLFQECCISHAGMWYLKGTLQSWHWEHAALPSPTANRILSWVSSGRASIEMRANHNQSSPSSEGRAIGGQKMSAACSEREAFLVSTEAYLTLTLWCSAEDRNSSHPHDRVWGVEYEYI